MMDLQRQIRCLQTNSTGYTKGTGLKSDDSKRKRHFAGLGQSIFDSQWCDLSILVQTME